MEETADNGFPMRANATTNPNCLVTLGDDRAEGVLCCWMYSLTLCLLNTAKSSSDLTFQQSSILRRSRRSSSLCNPPSVDNTGSNTGGYTVAPFVGVTATDSADDESPTRGTFSSDEAMIIDETHTKNETERQRRRRVEDDDELLIVKHKKEGARCVTLDLPTAGRTDDYALTTDSGPNPPQSGDGDGPCQFPSRNPEFAVEFHQSVLSVSIARLKTPPQHTHVPPVQNNQLGTGFGSWGRSVGLVPSVTPLDYLSAPCMGARGAIWAHIQILLSRNS